jgi:hypothetical protein
MIGMHAPFGWAFTPFGLEPVDTEQLIIQRALDLIWQGYSVRAVATILNDEGFASRGGGRIHPTQVQRWVRRSEA